MEEPSKKRRQTRSTIGPQRAKKQRLDGDASTDGDGHKTFIELVQLYYDYAKKAEESEPGPKQDRFKRMMVHTVGPIFATFCVNFLDEETKRKVIAANRALSCVLPENEYIAVDDLIDDIPSCLVNVAHWYGVKSDHITSKFVNDLANDIADTFNVDDQHMHLFDVHVYVKTIEALLWAEKKPNRDGEKPKRKHGFVWRNTWEFTEPIGKHKVADLIKSINRREEEAQRISEKIISSQCATPLYDYLIDQLYYIEVANLVDMLALRDWCNRDSNGDYVKQMNRPIISITKALAEELVPDMTKAQAKICMKFIDKMVKKTNDGPQYTAGVVFELHSAFADVLSVNER